MAARPPERPGAAETTVEQSSDDLDGASGEGSGKLGKGRSGACVAGYAEGEVQRANVEAGRAPLWNAN
jgi:hypothetical protein